MHVHPCWCIRRGLHSLVIRHLHELIGTVWSVWALHISGLELPQSDLRLRQWISGVMRLHLNRDVSVRKTEVWPKESKTLQIRSFRSHALGRPVVAVVLSPEPLPVTVRHDHHKGVLHPAAGLQLHGTPRATKPKHTYFFNQISLRRHGCVLERAVVGPQSACPTRH